MTIDVTNESVFRWTENATKAALALAEGKTRKEAALEADITERTLYRWLAQPEFAAEVDRLSLMIGISGRAERLRIVMRVVRQMVKDDRTIKTEKDLLDWLKYAQSETDGVKLDILKLAAVSADETPVAD